MRLLLLMLVAALGAAAEVHPTLHVTSERPWYRPGETVCLRALLLDAVTRAPLAAARPVVFRIADARGQACWSGLAAVADGVAAATWTAPETGGAYTVAATAGGAAAEPRRILVARTAEGLGGALQAELAFDRRGYAPGDTATVRLVLRGRDGAPAAGRPATLRVALGGAAAGEQRVVSDAEGVAAIQVAIPAGLERRDGTVTATIPEAGAEVLASRSLPLASAVLDLRATLDGGRLVAGRPAVIYLQARSEDGQPVDCRGSLCDQGGRALAAFATRHEGRARLDLVPAAGTAYRLVVEQPLRQELALPAVEPAGVALLGDAVQPAGGAVRLAVAASVPGRATLRLLRRGLVLAEQPLDLRPGFAVPAVLEPPTGAAGVMDAVLIAADGTRLAQRTLFRRPARRLALTLAAPAEAAPGAEPEVELRLVDAQGRPVPGLCSLSAVEAGDEDLIETRERPPRLPVLAWLDGEVEELADTGAYLGDEAEAAARLDLLLGVQG